MRIGLLKTWSWILGLVVSVAVSPLVTLAATTSSSMDSVIEGLNTTAEAGGFGSEAPDIFAVIGDAINVVIGLLGVVILILTVYAGFLYLMSQGDKEKAAKAQKILTYTIMGAVIILASYAIANFVLGGLNEILPQ